MMAVDLANRSTSGRWTLAQPIPCYRQSLLAQLSIEQTSPAPISSSVDGRRVEYGYGLAAISTSTARNGTCPVIFGPDLQLPAAVVVQGLEIFNPGR